MRGDLGGARAGGLLLVVIAACISIPMDAPLLALGLSVVPGAWWHLYPWLSPLPVPLLTGQGPACMMPGRFQSLAQLMSYHPHTHTVLQPVHPCWVDVRGFPVKPSSDSTMRTLPNQGEHRAASPSGWGTDGVSSLRKRGFGEICEGRRWVGVLWAGSSCVAPCWDMWCCAVAGGVALCCVGWWCAVLHCVVSNCGAVRDV